VSNGLPLLDSSPLALTMAVVSGNQTALIRASYMRTFYAKQSMILIVPMTGGDELSIRGFGSVDENMQSEMGR
jgi:hypothetical protein